jgi:hypothetical protein
MSKAAVVITILAQPMGCECPPIRLCAFGSDNKFTAVDVQRRLRLIIADSKKAGIGLLTYSADGNARELKIMRAMRGYRESISPRL